MISIIIPSYNRASSIEKSMQSVLCQTYKDIELIIVDDGSTDNTRSVVEAIDDNRVKYIYQSNAGACVARNTGIEAAKGEYIAFQDSDDVWASAKLEKQVEILNSRPEVDIVCCQTKCSRLDGTYFVTMSDCNDVILTSERGPFGISTQTLLMRREVTDQIRFDPKVTRFQDLDFMLAAIQCYKTFCVGEVLVERYIGDDSITNHAGKILDMSYYMPAKYAYLKDAKLNQFFANALLNCCYDNNLGDRKKIFTNRALELDSTVKTRIKVVSIRVGLYQTVKTIKRSLVKRG